MYYLFSGLQNVLRAIYGPQYYREKVREKGGEDADTELLSDEDSSETAESSAATADHTKSTSGETGTAQASSR